MADFSTEVRRLMAERLLSLRELARRAGCDPGHLSKVLNGRKPASPHLAGRLGEVLGDRDRLVQAAAGPVFNGSLAPEARDRLNWTVSHPERADAAAVESLTSVLAAQRKAEDALGSKAILRPVVAQLAVVDSLAAEARGPLRPAAIDAAQQWAQFAGWLYLNVADNRRSAARFRQALEHATELGDRTMIATVLSFRGYAAGRAGEPGPVIGLAQAAQQDDRVALSQRAYAAALEARGHALAGDAPPPNARSGKRSSWPPSSTAGRKRTGRGPTGIRPRFSSVRRASSSATSRISRGSATRPPRRCARGTRRSRKKRSSPIGRAGTWSRSRPSTSTPGTPSTPARSRWTPPTLPTAPDPRGCAACWRGNATGWPSAGPTMPAWPS